MVKFAFFMPFMGGETSEESGVEVEVEGTMPAKSFTFDMEAGAEVGSDGSDEARDEKSEKIVEEECFDAEDDVLEEEGLCGGVEEVKNLESAYLGVEDEATVEDEEHHEKEHTEVCIVTNVASAEEYASHSEEEEKEIDSEEIAKQGELDMEEIMNQEENGSKDTVFSEPTSFLEPQNSTIMAEYNNLSGTILNQGELGSKDTIFSEPTLCSDRQNTIVAADSNAFSQIDLVASNESVDSNSSMDSNVSEISNKLEAIMLDRIAAIDQIRNLLETELENDNDLIAEFTGKVSALEQDVMSKDDCIKALNQHVKELKIKNGDYSRELSSLSHTIDELVESNLTKTGLLVELEQDIATKKNALEIVNDQVQTKQADIITKAEENATLAQGLDTLKAENDGLKATIADLQSRNADYVEEFEHLLTSLKELVDQNSKLEHQVKELIDANKKLEEIQNTYNYEVEKNTRLQLEKEEIRTNIAVMTQEHNTTVSNFEDKLQTENSVKMQLTSEIIELRQTVATCQGEQAAVESRVESVTRSLEEAKVTIEAMRLEVDGLKTEKVQFLETVQKLEKVVDDTTSQMQAQLACQKSQFEQEVRVLEMGLESEIMSSGKLKKQYEEIKKKYHKEVEKNEKLKNQQDEMNAVEATQKAIIADLTADNTSLASQLKEEKMATIEIANRQASLETEFKSAKKSHKQEKTKLLNELKVAMENQAHLANAAKVTVASMSKDHKSKVASMEETHKAAVFDLDSKAEALRKELKQEKDTVMQIAESNAKVEAKMKSEKKAAAKESKELAEKFKHDLELVQKQLAGEKINTAQLQGLQGRLEVTEQQLVAAAKRRDDLAVMLEELRGLNAGLNKEVAESKENQAQLLVRIKNLDGRLDEKDAALSSITNEHSELVEKLTSTQECNSQLTSKIKGMQDDTAKNDIELHKLLDRMEETQHLLATATAEKDQVRTMYDDMEDLNKKLTNKLNKNRDDAAKTMTELHKRLMETENELSAMKSENDSLTKMRNELEETMLAQSREATAYKKRAKESDRTLVIMSKDKESLEKHMCALEHEIIELQVSKKEKESLEMRLAKSDADLMTLTKEKEALEKNINELQAHNESSACEIAELRSIQLRESAVWMETHTSLKNSLSENENSFAKISNEKNELEMERNALKTELKEVMKALKLVSTDLAELEQQKRELESDLYAKLMESKGKHNEAISSIQSRLNQTERTLTDIKSEKDNLERTVDELRLNNQDLSNELSESRSILSRESAEWQQEKIRLVDEKIKLTQRIYEVETTLVKICNQKTNLEAQKSGIERELSAELMETKGKHNKKIAEIQVRLQETERQLTSIMVEKETLQQTVNDLQDINHSMSLEAAEKSVATQESSVMTVESADWNVERSKLINRLMETERTLVLVASQNEDLEKQLSQEKETLKSRLSETEMTLVTVASEKGKLEKKNALLERKLRASSPIDLPPRPAQNDMSAELNRLQLSFLKEKKEMLGRQQGLEKMLMEALSFHDKKENSDEKTCARSTLRIDSRVKSEPRVKSHSTQKPVSSLGSTSSAWRKSVDPIDP